MHRLKSDIDIDKNCLESRAYYIDFNLATSGDVEVDGLVDKYGVCNMTARRDTQMYKKMNKNVEGTDNKIVRTYGFKSIYNI